MPRLTKDQWSAARIEWESDSTVNDSMLAEKYGISQQAVTKKRIQDGWQRHLTPMDELEIIKSKLMRQKEVKAKKI